MDKAGQVVGVSQIPGFKRVEIQSDGLEIGSLLPGSYIKIRYGNAEEPKYRSITISKCSVESFTLDFVDHVNTGLASSLAREIKIGQEIHFKGPGPASEIAATAKATFFYADPSALPAMNAHLEKINSSCEIHVFFEGADEVLTSYVDVSKIDWIKDKSKFVAMVKECNFSQTAFWAAGERNEILDLNASLLPHKPEFLSFYASSYWQTNKADEEHRLLKKSDPK